MTARRFEIQNGQYLEENDIVRVEDDYGRVQHEGGAAQPAPVVP